MTEDELEATIHTLERHAFVLRQNLEKREETIQKLKDDLLRMRLERLSPG